MVDFRCTEISKSMIRPPIGTIGDRAGPGAAPTPWPTAPDRELRRCVDLYVEGWAAADTTKLAEAVSADYRFKDPLVGDFDRETLPDYLAILRRRLGFDRLRVDRCKIYLCRYAPLPSQALRIRFQRWIPEVGLIGTADLQVHESRICREVVCYGWSLAAELLRNTT